MFFRVLDKSGVKVREGITNLTPERLKDLPPGCVVLLRNNDGTWVRVKPVEIRNTYNEEDTEPDSSST